MEIPLFGIFTILIGYAFFVVLPFWTILRKAGYHPGWSLLVFVPGVNVIALYVFAFSSWPNLKQSKQ